MRASGLGAWMFVRIIAIFAVATWLLALVNGVSLALMSSAALSRLENKLRTSQASFEIQRVFYEDFKNMVLYVEDVRSGSNASEWRGVFLADVTDPTAPKITLARNGIITADDPNSLHMHLEHGSQQVVQPPNPDQYEVSTFAQTDLPIALPAPDEAKQDLVPVGEMSTAELWKRGHHPELDTGAPRNPQDTPAVRARWYLVEFHRRLALPTSCLVLALVGIPLGLSSKKGGKSMGFVLTIVLVFLYYFASLTGISLGRSGKIPPGVGVWAANFLFLVAGVVLLYRVERSVIDLGSLGGAWDAMVAAIRSRFTAGEELATAGPRAEQQDAGSCSEDASACVIRCSWMN